MPVARPRADRRPRFVAPQLATLVNEPPAGRQWLHEVKYDGYRIECLLHERHARLITRGRQDWTGRFPAIAAAVQRLPARSAIIDGELVALDATGRSRFQLLQQAIEQGTHHRLRYAVFDLLQLDGEDLRPLPFTERRARLRALLRRAHGRARGITLSRELAGTAAEAFRRACRGRLEGIICKERDAPYRGTRSRSWLKVKCGHQQEFVVAGFTLPRGSREGVGALLLGVHDRRGRLRYAGRVGTGMSREMLLQLRQRLERIARTTSPLSDGPVAGHWVRPSLVVEVRFTEWTADGLLRHPAFLGLRIDKAARDVVKEVAR